MDALTKEEVLACVEVYAEDSFSCPECLGLLKWVEDDSSDRGHYYCSNDSCLNNQDYDKGGNII